MTDTLRWLDELGPDAPERELLVAGRDARPPPGTADAEWQALCVALAATAGASGAAASGVVANSVAAKGASGIVVSKAALATSFGIGVKWFVAGAALGCGVASMSAVVQHVGTRERSRTPEPLVAAARTPAPKPRAPDGAVAFAPRAGEPARAAAEPPSSDSARLASAEVRAGAAEPATLPPVSVPGPASAEFAPALAPSTAPLAEQARELAEVKRLIDAGSASEALRRLEATRSGGVPFALAEERDALYAQALDEAGRRAPARAAARVFVARYPRSPYLETLRRLLAEE
jgi:hypothetical protein